MVKNTSVMMTKTYRWVLETAMCGAIMALAGCSSVEDAAGSRDGGEPRELQGIQAVIVGGQQKAATRAGAVTPLQDYVGRRVFKGGDHVVFTKISRTDSPISEFIYPGAGATYSGVVFDAEGTSGDELGWQRSSSDGAPDRVFWTDATSFHTFVAYSIPEVTGTPFDWTKSGYGFYQGTLGDGTSDIDYTLTESEQVSNRKEIMDANNNVTGYVYYNPKLENEDLLLTYDTEMKAQPGGSVALVKFYHGLSSIRVIVNINGFSTGESAKYDNAAKVLNIKLLNHPLKYEWKQQTAGTEPIAEAGQVRKDISLWIPNPEGSGTAQSRTFTFYGITTPQPKDYIDGLAVADNRKVSLAFDVNYPDPMQPSDPEKNKTFTYKASLDGVYFEANHNTTINITLNHKDEQMTVGAEYENWQFVATLDHGELKKNSTFLQSTVHDGTNVTIVGDPKATADDATWLYQDGNNVKDIYGHLGNSVDDAYQISTADQLLSLAYEVKADRDFSGKFIRLDADITLQKTPDKTKSEMNSEDEGYGDAPEAIEWIGIGDDNHAFKGTFLGGKRFIYRLKGKPLFAKLGTQAHIQQLQVNSVHRSDGSTPAVTGAGLFADSNAGMLSGCTVVGDVALDGSTAGALVGTNTGSVWCCYHVGATIGTASEAVGGLVGSNSGKIACCYHSGKVTGTNTGGITASNTGTLDHNYYNSSLLTPTVTTFGDTEVIGKSSAEMTKQDFVTEINTAIGTWRGSNTGYDPYHYVYQPANYPNLESGGQ